MQNFEPNPSGNFIDTYLEYERIKKNKNVNICQKLALFVIFVKKGLPKNTRPCTTVRNSECQLLEGSGWVVIGILKSRQHDHIWFVSCGEIFI